MSRAWIIRMGPQEWKFSWTQAMEKLTQGPGLVSRLVARHCGVSGGERSTGPFAFSPSTL